MKTETTALSALPLTLRADDVARILGISRSSAYSLLRSRGFPVIEVGRRKIIPRDALMVWINRQVGITDEN